MSKSIHVAQFTNATITASGSTGICLSGHAGTSGTELRQTLVMRTAGTVSDLTVYVSSNANDGTTTFKSRKNGADGNLTLSVSASTTGLFEDNVNSDTIAAADTYNFLGVGSGTTGSLIYQAVTSVFNATSNTANQLMSNVAAAFSTASTTEYIPISGIGTTTATEANAQSTVRTAGTLKNGFVRIQANTRTTTTDYRTRINGVNGNILVSVAGSSTGAFEDTVNTDSVAAADEINYSVTTSTGTGSITANIVSTVYETTNNKFQIAGGAGAGLSLNNQTRYFPLYGGNFGNISPEANTQSEINFAWTASNFGVYVSANAATATSTADVRVGAASSALTVSVTAAATGWFEDTSNTVALVAGDDVNFRVAAGTGGASVWHNFTMVGTVAAGAVQSKPTWPIAMTL